MLKHDINRSDLFFIIVIVAIGVSLILVFYYSIVNVASVSKFNDTAIAAKPTQATTISVV